MTIPARSPVDEALDRLDYWDTIEAALTTIPESSPYRETALRSLDHLKERVLTNHATVREALERLRRHPDAWSQEAFDQQKARADAAEAEVRQLRDERDAALRIAPAVRLVLEKVLRADMTKPPVTHAELRFALDLLPESPSFFASVSGMEQLAAAEERARRLEDGLREIEQDVNDGKALGHIGYRIRSLLHGLIH